MWYVGYKFSDLNAWQESEHKTEADAMAEAVELLTQGYIVQVNEE